MSIRENDRAIAYMKAAKALATLATCPRAKVACILTDDKGHILSTGYNGKAQGQKHCDKRKAERHSCKAIHAEQNALMQISDYLQAKYAYVTMSPCIHCMKMLSNTNIHTIYYAEEYRDTSPLDWWLSIGRRAFEVSSVNVKPYIMRK